MSPHELVAERSLALHRAVAERLLREPELVEAARRRVQAWLEHGTVAKSYAEAWSSVLAASLPEIVSTLTQASERMHDLRQVSPFAGFLDPRARWRIRRAVADRRHATR